MIRPDGSVATVAGSRITLGEELLVMLENYAFPGNVRELRSLTYDAVCRAADGEALSMIPFLAAMAQAEAKPVDAQTSIFPAMLPTLAQMQDLLIAEALRRSGGNQAQAALMLGVTRQAINKRVSHDRRQPFVNQG